MKPACALAVVLLAASPASAAELQPRTIAAFDRYVGHVEARMDGNGPFLWLDSLDEPRRTATRDDLRRNGLVIERRQAADVPGGLVHHWLGVVFVPGATVDRVLGLLQAYDRHAEIYQPSVARSKQLARDGNHFRAFLRFRMKKIVTVVVN